MAEHSLLTSQIIQRLWPKSGQMMAGLLHDASVAYTHDIQTPIRRFVRVTLPSGETLDWAGLEKKINDVVGKAFGLPPYFYSQPEVKAADILALCLEKARCPAICDRNWGLPAIPEEVKDMAVEFMPPDRAKEAFLARFNDLWAMGGGK